MKTDNDIQVEKLINNLMADINLELKSSEGDSSLISKIAETVLSKNTIYKPLISKKSWAMIFCVVVLVIYFFLQFDFHNLTEIKKYNFDFLNNFLLKDWLVFKPTLVTKYVILSLSFMLIVQVIFLKKHFSHRIDMEK